MQANRKSRISIRKPQASRSGILLEISDGDHSRAMQRLQDLADLAGVMGAGIGESGHGIDREALANTFTMIRSQIQDAMASLRRAEAKQA